MAVFDVRIDFSFTAKAFAHSHIMHQVGANNLDSYLTVKSSMLACEIDFAHATHIDATNQMIVAKAELTLLWTARTLLLIIQALLFVHMFVFKGSMRHILTFYIQRRKKYVISKNSVISASLGTAQAYKKTLT